MMFTCDFKNEKWEGTISRIVKHTSYEFWINSRSSIMVVFGATTRGAFVCIPDFKGGCHLSALKDKFWNTEQLVDCLGAVDGITVSTALYTLRDKIILDKI